MEIRIISKTDRQLILEVHGEDHTLGNLLMKEALRHPGVEYASYRIPHPLRSSIEFIIVVKNGLSLSQVVSEIIDSLRNQIKEFQSAVLEALGQD